jgi:hypothetical protein
MFKSHAPIIAAAAPGIANLKTTCQSAFLPTSIALNILFARWTTAVAAIATGKGKNNAKAGISTVPSPKPENNVKADTITATRQMII